LSTSDPGDDALDFDAWIEEEFARRGAFTACVVLVGIGEQSVTPLASTYLNVVGTETGWLEIVALFAGAGMPWDGAVFFPATASGGGPLDNAGARTRLREIEARVKAEMLTVNEGFFFDRQGRRMMVEEMAPQ
jgi:hypothetical protein